MNARHVLLYILPVILLCLVLAPNTQACPACKDSIEQAAGQRSNKPATSYQELSETQKAYSWSVLALLVVPFACVSFIVSYGLKLQAQHQKLQSQQKEGQPLLTNA